MTGRIHSTESFGTVDGPGVRFVVFMQGCPMRCAYCHNPDTWDMSGGREVTADELLAEYDSCKEFLKNGGITVTGGEPLMQAEFVTELFEKAHEKGIHTCLDTSGVTFSRKENVIEKFEKLISVTNLVMLDIKHIDDEKHIKLTAHGNGNILDFAEWLKEKGVPVWIRHVVVPDITDGEDELFRLGEFIGGLSNLKALDVLPYHNMGESKYETLGIEYSLKNVPSLDKQEAVKARNIIMNGIKARVRRDRV
ncbi:MAG: pyruvate formate lyase-activating protein [Oscillospiraceae bacterium]|nr:pyruvate formate lyase-activating protein [Oscillospiraceae bacterium]